MVFPAPGGPIRRMLWAPAAATSSARLAADWPRTSAKSTGSGTSAGHEGVQDRRAPAGIGWTPREVSADLRQGPGAPDLEVLDDRGFGQVVRRQEQCVAPGGPGGQGHREGPPDRAQVALQAHLSQDHGMFEVGFRDLAAGQQKAQGDRQIQSGTILAYVRGSQIDRDPPQWEVKAGVGEGRGDPLPALLHRAVRQTDGGERRQPVADIDLDFDRECVDTQYGGGSDAREHGRPSEGAAKV